MQCQPFFPIEPIDQFPPYRLALAIEQHAYLPIAISHSGLTQFPQSLAEGRPLIPVTPILVRGSVHPERPTRLPFADWVMLTEIGKHRPFPRGRQNFFASTS